MKRFGMIILAVSICAGKCLFPAFAESITTLSGENVFETQNTDVRGTKMISYEDMLTLLEIKDGYDAIDESIGNI